MRQARNEALPCAMQLAARKRAPTIDQAENLQDVLTALQYCIESPWDIAALAICAGCLRQSASIYRAFADTLLVNQGLTFGYEMQRPRRTSAMDGCTKAKPADDAVTLIIGVNHTGSLSLVDALKDCLGTPEVLELDAYSTVSDGTAMPRLCDEIESLSANFRGLGKLPRVLYSHRPIPMHLCLPEGTPYRYVTMLRNPVSRLVALHYWLVKHRHTSFHWMHPIVKQGGSLDDYLAHFHQSGARPGGFAPAEYFHRSWVELGLVPDDCRDDPVKAASHVLDRHFSVVGITELFDETLFVLSRTTGARHPAALAPARQLGSPEPSRTASRDDPDDRRTFRRGYRALRELQETLRAAPCRRYPGIQRQYRFAENHRRPAIDGPHLQSGTRHTARRRDIDMNGPMTEHGNFTGLAGDYSRNRPDYSASVLSALLGLFDRPTSAVDFVDVGAGTGIWTRMVAARNVRSTIAVEPNEDMRQHGIADSTGQAVVWRSGSAETTGLDDSSCDWLTMASSFHWADFDLATKEFHRVLRPSGRFTALWNPRLIEANPLLVEIEAYLTQLKPDLQRRSSGRSGITEQLSERLENSPYFEDVVYVEGRHIITMPVERYLGAWRSVNDLRVQLGSENFELFMKQVEARTSALETIETTYLTRAWSARRRG